LSNLTVDSEFPLTRYLQGAPTTARGPALGKPPSLRLHAMNHELQASNRQATPRGNQAYIKQAYMQSVVFCLFDICLFLFYFFVL
jgi:hypothetical protein